MTSTRRHFGPTVPRHVMRARGELAAAVELGGSSDVREMLRLVDQWLATRPASVRADLTWYFGAKRAATVFGEES